MLRLLVFRLRCYGSHPRLLDRRPDRPSICCVGIDRLDERPNELRMQQHHLVPERPDLAGPPPD